MTPLERMEQLAPRWRPYTREIAERDERLASLLWAELEMFELERQFMRCSRLTTDDLKFEPIAVPVIEPLVPVGNVLS